MSLFKMWEDAHINKKLPKEWRTWEDFRTWAITNRYKAEYGYRGEFSPQKCLKAMRPDTQFDPDKTMDIQAALLNNPGIVIGIDLASGPDKTVSRTIKNDKPSQKGASNASKKTNTRGRNGNSV